MEESTGGYTGKTGPEINLGNLFLISLNRNRGLILPSWYTLEYLLRDLSSDRNITDVKYEEYVVYVILNITYTTFGQSHEFPLIFNKSHHLLTSHETKEI